MKFEVRYPTGTVHEVELQGSLAVLGRDPSCDLVLNDAKCSRRHAVIEAGPDGLSIRDSGSANGIYVNAKRVERSPLQEGDEIRLGEVLVKVLGEEMPGTLVMGPDEMMEMQPPAAPSSSALPRRPMSQDSTPTVPPAVPLPPPPPPPPATPVAIPRPARAPAPLPRSPTPPRPVSTPSPPPRPAGMRMGAPERMPRPLTATVLAVLWLVFAVMMLFGGAFQVWAISKAGGSVALPLLSVFVSMMAGIALGVGLLSRQPWGRFLQMGVSALGLITCVMTPLSALSLYYMMRPATRIQFSGRQTFRELEEDEADIVRAAEGEGLFTGGIFVSLLLGAILAGLLAMLALSTIFSRMAS